MTVPRVLSSVATVVLMLAVAVAPAGATVEDAERAPTLRIVQLDAEPDGSTRLTVSVSGLAPGVEVSPEQLEVVENGEVVEGLEVADVEAESEDAVVPGVVIALDTSGSTQGEPIEAARTAAVQLVEDVAAGGGRVGVVGFGSTTQTIAQLSESADAAVAGISRIQATGKTALYDGVSRAARLLASHDGPRDVIVFSDGGDTSSQSTLDDVRGLLAETGVRVTSVALRSEGFTVAPLAALAAVNGGTVVEVGSATELAEAFQAIAGDLTNRLDVVWTAEPVADPAPVLNVVASYDTGGGVISDGEQVESPRLAAVTQPVPVEGPQPLVPALASGMGLAIAAGAAGLAILVLLFLILVGAGERSRRADLDERLTAYQPGVGEKGRDDRLSLSDRASSAFDVIPRPANLDSRIAESIERADWPLRVSEFLLTSFGVAVLGLLIGGVLLGSGILAGLLLVVGLAGPWIYLQAAVKRRQAAFADQLPTVLQVLAGALRAGHAFSTALENAVEEVDEPAKGELRRAAVEARLGRPLDRALNGVAERMDSIDLQWVIGALEVQREVGGNLAEILGNVAATLRDRASLARHVKALTAEGRLSAAFIAAMPFVMFAYLTVTNPDYVQPLFTDPIGRFMLIAGLVMLVAGVVVLRRLIRPKF